MKRTLMWKGDNSREFNRTFESEGVMVRAVKTGTKLLLSGLNIPDTELEVGECVILDGERLGIIRGEVSDEPRLRWTGENFSEVRKFLEKWQVSPWVRDRNLLLRSDPPDDRDPVVLKPGDDIILRGNYMVISYAGKDHRV